MTAGMGTGRQLGQQLQHWLRDSGSTTLPPGNALANRWSDALGSDEALKAPLRDLASRPLLRVALRQGGAAQRATLEQLSAELQRTYNAAVMAELLDLLEAFADVTLPRPTGEASEEATSQATASRGNGPPSGRPAPLEGAMGLPAWLLRHGGSQMRRLRRRLEPMAPGLALAAAAALVWMWVGRELDRLLFEAWGWSGGAVLLLLLALIEGLGLPAPLHRWQGAALLLPVNRSGSSRQAWRWITAPWQQPSRRQAVLNLGLLAVILGPSALQLQDVLLRYALVSLASLTLAALVAAQHEPRDPAPSPPNPGLGGSSAAVASLIGLGVGLSLLQGRQLSYTFGPLAIPVWVLLLIDASCELSWLAQRPSAGDGAPAAERPGAAPAPAEPAPALWNRRQLLSQPWTWGLLLGLSWAVVSRLQGLLLDMQQASPQA